ncbi:hypothetical protein ACFDD5_08915, partial [Enterococcus lactis]|nr:hypothetical protein [Enterococcus lactis]
MMLKNSFSYFTKSCLMADRLSLEHHLFRIRGCDKIFVTVFFPTISQVKGVRKIAHKRKRQNQGTPNKASFVKNFRSGQRSGI